MKTTRSLIAQAVAIGVAASFTLATLAGIDTLATEQHAATVLAKSRTQPAAGAQTAAIKAPAPRS